MSDDQYRRFHSFLKLKGFNLTRQFRLKGDIISETYEYKGTLVDIDYCDTDDNGVQYLEYDIGENTQIVKKSGRYYYKYMDVMIYHAVPFEIKREYLLMELYVMFQIILKNILNFLRKKLENTYSRL